MYDLIEWTAEQPWYDGDFNLTIELYPGGRLYGH